MNILGKAAKQTSNWLIVVLMLAMVGLMPVASFAQQEEGDQDEQYSTPSADPSSTTSGLSTNPWGNSTTTETGTTAAGTEREENQEAGDRPSTNATSSARGGTAARPRPGGTTLDGVDPGGNPDVPFDPWMNLTFLAFGLGFVMFVLRKQLKVAAVTTK
jgi:hypothetical protein